MSKVYKLIRFSKKNKTVCNKFIYLSHFGYILKYFGMTTSYFSLLLLKVAFKCRLKVLKLNDHLSWVESKCYRDRDVIDCRQRKQGTSRNPEFFGVRCVTRRPLLCVCVCKQNTSQMRNRLCVKTANANT